MEKYTNKKWLEHQYIGLRRSPYEICKEFNVSARTIYNYLKKFALTLPAGILFKGKEGHKHTKEYKKKMSEIRKGKNNPMYGRRGKDSPRWKGDNVGYYGLHIWIKNNKFKPKNCSFCGLEKKLDLANISGEYKRDINDYIYICRKCHNNLDKPYLKRERDDKGRFK